ncbi:MAG: (d)CMP kinase [Ignavibacteria bacterium]|nr:(d)CMP kinase [Ignavibacteria bacterium]MBI3765223.1 (d)CMP kinase [Ignavibacteriales bacterium]
MKKLVIAIDGPAASGKSTTSKLIAKRLGYLYVDTGAMYRAMTLKVLQQNISLDQTETIGRLAKRTQIRLDQSDGELKVFLDNRDVTQAIRNQAVTRAVSTVSMIKKVREVMVREQRRMGKRGGIVLEGRDIGTVVFPNADLKIFMVAHVEERARRRQKELKKQGVKVSVEQLVKELVERDRKDSKRDISPLQKAEDAVILDTSKMTLVGQADFVVQKVQEILKKR